MAYNTNTRLLLQFDGASATTDTSSFARACSKTTYATINTGVSPHGTGNSLYCNGLADNNLPGTVFIEGGNADAVFTSTTIPWLISLHYFVDSGQYYSYDGLMRFFLYNNNIGSTQSIRLMTYDSGAIAFVNDYEWLESTHDSSNEYGTGWHHLYLYMHGNNVRIGRDGTEILNTALADPVRIDGDVSIIVFGDADVIPHHGGLDSIQLFEGTVPWNGGSYTVPGRPDDYSVSSTITGVGVVALADVTTSGAAVMGFGDISGVGTATLSDVQSATSLVFGQTPYNSNTRLQMRFNEANGATSTVDSSIFGRASTFFGSAKISSTRSKYGGGSLALGNVGGTAAHGYVKIESPEGMFSTVSNLPKTFDLFYAVDAGIEDGIKGIFSVTLQNGDLFVISKSKTTNGTTGLKQHSVEVRYIQNGGPTTSHFSAQLSFEPPDTSFVHARIRVAGGTIRIGLNGVDYGSVSRSPAGDVWRQSDISKIHIGVWGESLTAYGIGYLDSLVVLENDSSWTGGAYLVPSAEPGDPGALPDIIGDGAATLSAVASSGVAQALIGGTSAIALEDVASVAAGTVGTASSISGVGAATLDPVASAGVGALVCAGSSAVQLSGVIGSGSGSLPLSASGSATVGVLSAGQAAVGVIGAGSAEVGVSSQGVGSLLVKGVGSAVINSIFSAGQGGISVFGAGASTVSVESSGEAGVTISGVGQANVADVKTYFPPGWDWHVQKLSVRTARNEMRVTL